MVTRVEMTPERQDMEEGLERFVEIVRDDWDAHDNSNQLELSACVSYRAIQMACASIVWPAGGPVETSKQLETDVFDFVIQRCNEIFKKGNSDA